jgi:hypothetical protein
MWGNPEREREILLFSFRKVHTTTKSQFPAKRKYLTTPKQSPKFSALKTCQIRTVVRPPQILCLEKCANRVLYDLHSTTQQQQEKLQKTASIFVPKTASKIVPLSLLYGLYGSVQYGLQQQKNDNTLTQKISLGFVPTLSWEMCPPSCSLSSLKLYSKISLNLLLDVSCTLPNAFFYKYF